MQNKRFRKYKTCEKIERLERRNLKCCTAAAKYGGGKVLVCGCSFGQSIGPIHEIIGIMYCFMYTDILENAMLPYAEEGYPLKFSAGERSFVYLEALQNLIETDTF